MSRWTRWSTMASASAFAAHCATCSSSRRPTWAERAATPRALSVGPKRMREATRQPLTWRDGCGSGRWEHCGAMVWAAEAVRRRHPSGWDAQWSRTSEADAWSKSDWILDAPCRCRCHARDPADPATLGYFHAHLSSHVCFPFYFPTRQRRGVRSRSNDTHIRHVPKLVSFFLIHEKFVCVSVRFGNLCEHQV